MEIFNDLLYHPKTVANDIFYIIKGYFRILIKSAFIISIPFLAVILIGVVFYGLFLLIGWFVAIALLDPNRVENMLIDSRKKSKNLVINRFGDEENESDVSE